MNTSGNFTIQGWMIFNAELSRRFYDRNIPLVDTCYNLNENAVEMETSLAKMTLKK